MALITALAGLVLIFLMLTEGFEAMVWPRRVTRPYRFTRFFYRFSWQGWVAGSRWIPVGKKRETYLSLFGPLSLLSIFALWVSGLIFGFGIFHWSIGTRMRMTDEEVDFLTYLYFSGQTFFTLGFGELTPVYGLGRFLAVLEAGMGFGFMALIIGYLPVLYQAFSKREVTISMLDARAGSPPSAAQLLFRLAQAKQIAAVNPLLGEWERWAAEVLESHLSFPGLSYYRSQHDNQSWIGALTTMLDTSTLLLTCVKGADRYQAQLTFAMARHAVVDLALIFDTPPKAAEPDRLSPDMLVKLREDLTKAGLEMKEGSAVDAKLTELRSSYEPFANSLAQFLQFRLPPIVPDKITVDNWQTSAWMRRIAGIGKLASLVDGDEHFD
jgi:hypothetical protein